MHKSSCYILTKMNYSDMQYICLLKNSTENLKTQTRTGTQKLTLGTGPINFQKEQRPLLLNFANHQIKGKI